MVRCISATILPMYLAPYVPRPLLGSFTCSRYCVRGFENMLKDPNNGRGTYGAR